jgi:hypothetical protein
MSEVALFAIGSVFFMATTWATLAFGMQRIHQVQMRELEASDRISEVRTEGLTELHMTTTGIDEGTGT